MSMSTNRIGPVRAAFSLGLGALAVIAGVGSANAEGVGSVVEICTKDKACGRS